MTLWEAEQIVDFELRSAQRLRGRMRPKWPGNGQSLVEKLPNMAMKAVAIHSALIANPGSLSSYIDAHYYRPCSGVKNAPSPLILSYITI